MQFENQKMIEELFNAKQTPKLLRQKLLEEPIIVALIQLSALPEDFAIDLMSQMVLAKRATVPTLVGILKRHFIDKPNPWQACADALHHAVEADLVDFDPEDGENGRFIVRWDADEATHALIRQYQFLPPMIVPPLEVIDDGVNRGSGYLTIKTDSLLLQDNHHGGDLCVDSLNKFNAIPLTCNIEVVKGIRNSWRNMDAPKADESFEDYKKRCDAFLRYERDSFNTIALMEAMGNEFFLTHKPDKRGRTYAQGYHINPQGNVWNKAVVELARKETLRQPTNSELMIQCALAAGKTVQELPLSKMDLSDYEGLPKA